ncbi:Molybdopterin molybdenumtransferase [Commensalibacter sp. Nvir]|uniref:molybdopterin molybdotransferase MoeA n=1 Tax=Commensalibacter sp. Nvir TaxID=3069817 RepID=UPI002D5A92D1|nr:Molybdopterin molybdenumtransferase [Commensalibacter sp. Nvir]
MMDYRQALTELLSAMTARQDCIQVSALDAVNYILAKNLYAQYDSPFFDNSAMDGYALGSYSKSETKWEIIDRVTAGDDAHHIKLKSGQAVRIFTGALIPKGTVTVVQQEICHIEAKFLSLTHSTNLAQNIRKRGEEFKKGSLLVAKGQRLTPGIISVITSQGYQEIPIIKPLSIIVFSTGNELIQPNEPLTAGKIYDANRYMLLNWLKQSRHTIIDGGVLSDNFDKTREALLKASQQADVVVTSGGVSVGEEDHVLTSLKSVGELRFWKLAIKPGKPFAWGEIGPCKVFMLPGNPVSSLVTFQQLVIPALKVMGGEPVEKSLPQFYLAKANFVLVKDNSRREFLRVNVYYDTDGLRADKLLHQGSAMLGVLAQANALAEIPPHTLINKEDLIKIYFFSSAII